MFFEIHADDPAAAKDFYGQLFGWEFTKQEGAPVEFYDIKTNGINGGLLKRSAPVVSGGANAFVCSIEVDNFDSMAQKILSLGGKVAMQKFAVPGRCWQGYFIDTQGNTFGIFEVNEAAA